MAFEEEVVEQYKLSIDSEVEFLRSKLNRRFIESRFFVPRDGLRPQRPWMTEKEVLRKFRADSGQVVSPLQLSKIIQALVQEKRLEERFSPETGRTLFRLSSKTFVEFIRLDDQFASNLEQVGRSVFGAEYPDFKASFNEAVSELFARYGNDIAKQLLGRLDASDFITASDLERIAYETCRRNTGLDVRRLSDGLKHFINGAGPDYIFVKWEYAQRFYASKLMGLDPKGWYLTKVLLQGSRIYLDTNVIMYVLESSSPYYRVTKELMSIGSKLGITWIVSSRTLTELERLLKDSSPTSRILRTLRDQLSDNGHLSIEDLIDAFGKQRSSILRSKLNIEFDNSQWFEDMAVEGSVTRLAHRLSRRPPYLNPHHAEKGSRRSLHDALNIMRVAFLRADGDRSVWFLTNDFTLPGALLEDGQIPPVITLDALSQWLTDVEEPNDPEAIRRAFAKVLRKRLTPGLHFEEADFRYLQHLNHVCASLPEGELHTIVNLIREQGLRHDPDDPDSLQEISYIIQRQLLVTVTEGQRDLEERIRRLIERAKEETRAEFEASESTMLRSLENSQKAIAQAKDENDALRQKALLADERSQRVVLQTEGWRRLTFVGVIFFVASVAIAYLGGWQAGQAPMLERAVLILTLVALWLGAIRVALLKYVTEARLSKMNLPGFVVRLLGLESGSQ